MTAARVVRTALVASLLLGATRATAQEATPAGPPPPTSTPPRDPPPITALTGDPPLFGDKDDLLYFRDPHDYIRLYPHARISADARWFFGARAATTNESTADADLGTRFFLREARLGLGGELLQRFAFYAAMDLAANPAIDGAAVGGNSRRLTALSDAWSMVDDGRGLSLIMGYFQAPFSLENRTDHSDLSLMERSLAIRGFVVPGGKVLGASTGGVAMHDVARWDLGLFGGESFVPGRVTRSFQWLGRVRVQPVAAETSSPLRHLQFGMSLRLGWRDPRDAMEDAPAINTGQGFSLFRPTLDEDGRTVHIIPNGAQWAVGGEFRLPYRNWVLTSEAYRVTRHTEERDFAHPDTIERLGSLEGWGWYVQVSTWLLQFLRVIDGEPHDCGEYPHPEHLEVANLPPRVGRYGVELALLAAGVNASYRGNSIIGKPSDITATNIEAYQFGFGINYWQTVRFRLSLSYSYYLVPHAGSNGNLGVVPATIDSPPDLRSNGMSEFATRATLMF